MNEADKAQMAINHLLTASEYLADLGLDVSLGRVREVAAYVKAYQKYILTKAVK